MQFDLHCAVLPQTALISLEVCIGYLGTLCTDSQVLIYLGERSKSDRETGGIEEAELEKYGPFCGTLLVALWKDF